MIDELLGQYEIMDRSFNLAESLANQILEHPDLTKDQKTKLQLAHNLLMDVYQLAGNELCKNERIN